MANRFTYTCLAALMASGCMSSAHQALNEDALIREGLAGTGANRPSIPIQPENPTIITEETKQQSTRQQIVRGNRNFVANANRQPKVPQGPASERVSFNFSNQPIEAVITIILGELLGADFTIAQGVTGEVSFSTSKPVDKSQALSILETLLSWTNNALIRQGDRYVVLPASKAVAGQLIPTLPISSPESGLTARLFVLDFISATEMQKLLKPFARENAFLLVDSARNILVMAGTPDELNNYQQTIDTFDLNWLKGMSIGVYGLQRASVAELIPELNYLFGPESSTPLAGMVRFMPIERTNAIVAISTQPEYLTEVGRWIETIDQGGGNEPQLYVYDVRNIKATDLARYLRQIFDNEDMTDEVEGQVAPGLRTLTLSSNSLGGRTDNNINVQNDLSIMSGSEIGLGDPATYESREHEPTEENDATRIHDLSPNGDSRGNSVRITAQKSSNQLLVRSRPSQWNEIQSAIRRLDNPPMQVQIETRILEVSLTGALSLGVQWYLGRLAGNSSVKGIENASGSQAALGRGGAGLNKTDALFYSFVSDNLQVALHALETNGTTKVLSAPSLVVMNNQQAQIQVGDNIPINQTTINLDNILVNTSSVQYLQTGVILDVLPRINPGGLVYMDIQQQVSDASAIVDSNGNPSISTRAISTQVAVQSGQTVLLGGLIQQDEVTQNSSVPYLGRLPVLNWLFGNSQRARGRSELIVLITPKVINSDSSARQVTDEYRQQLQLIKPIEERP